MNPVGGTGNAETDRSARLVGFYYGTLQPIQLADLALICVKNEIKGDVEPDLPTALLLWLPKKGNDHGRLGAVDEATDQRHCRLSLKGLLLFLTAPRLYRSRAFSFILLA